MTKLKRKVLAAAISCLVCGGAFAQKQGDKRPPKDPNKVVVTDKKNERPPPNNNQGNRGNGDKKGKP